MTAPSPYVIEDLDGFEPAAVFAAGRDQVVVAVRLMPVFGRLDLTVLAGVVDEANARGFALARESLQSKDEWLLCVFEAYDEDEG